MESKITVQSPQPKLNNNDEAEGVITIQLQINYEDTDAGGVVYYGNYLGYMERARNAYLRSLGYPLGKLANENHLLFVVTEAKISYLSPGKLDDELVVSARIESVGGAHLVFNHQVLRGRECLVRATIKLATLDSRTLRPCRIPKFISTELRE